MSLAKNVGKSILWICMFLIIGGTAMAYEMANENYTFSFDMGQNSIQGSTAAYDVALSTEVIDSEQLVNTNPMLETIFSGIWWLYEYMNTIATGGSSGSNVTGTLCRYKQLGYYNEAIPFLKELNCI